MLIDQDKELKNAILSLPVKEKDKLLLKLISKNIVLMNQLRYKLLEADELEEKREEVLERIEKEFQRLRNYSVEWPAFFTPGQLMMEIRAINGIVNEHILITKDKTGDVELRLLIFEKLFDLDLNTLKTHSSKNEKLLAYLAGRVKYILDKYSKLHEDYQYDLQERVNDVLRQVNASSINAFTEELNLPSSV